MSVNHPTSTAPIPLRPLNRTRRRSSSLSAIYTSSPEPEQPHPSRADRKTPKRSRVTRNPPSPLKQSQHAIGVVFPVQLGSNRHSHAASPYSESLASRRANPTPPTTFTSSAFDFSLPPTSAPRPARIRTSSSPSTSTATLALPQPLGPASVSPLASSWNTSLVSYQTHFADSSFSSFDTSSSPPSPPSAATSPPSPPTFAFLSSRTSSLDQSDTSYELVEDGHQDRAGMKLDDPLSAQAAEAERLHHVAFEELRRSTREDEEGFVDRMRRWEYERATEAKADIVLDDPEDVHADDEDDDDELDLEVQVSLVADAEEPAGRHRRAATDVDLDELTTRMRNGACELEDYSLVRQLQAQTTFARHR